jgi:hypothetical protein
MINGTDLSLISPLISFSTRPRGKFVGTMKFRPICCLAWSNVRTGPKSSTDTDVAEIVDVEYCVLWLLLEKFC